MMAAAYLSVIATFRASVVVVPCDSAALITSIQSAVTAGGNQTIELAASCTYTLTTVNNGSGVNTNGLPRITNVNLTIVGNNATITRSTSGVPAFRIFQIDSGATLALNQLTVSGGRTPSGSEQSGGHGGGIYNSGTLTVNGCVIANNTTGDATGDNNSGGDGAGIYNLGTLTVTNSQLNNNVTGFLDANYVGARFGSGGGIYSSNFVNVSGTTFKGNSGGVGGGLENRGATAIISGCTFDSNVAEVGAGVSNYFAGGVTITNSTFYNNSASDEGGGIWSDGPMTVNFCTIVHNNSVNLGGGLYVAESSFVVKNSILADNPSGGNCGVNVAPAPAVTDGGYNIDDGNTCGFSAANNSQPNTDPKVDANGLRDHGGPTNTIALQADSPAIDAIDGGTNGCGAISTDQRGISRPLNGKCDIGAYEADSCFAAIPFADASQLNRFNVHGQFSFSATAGVGGGGGVVSSSGNYLDDAAIFRAGAPNDIGDPMFVELDYKMAFQGIGPDLRVGFSTHSTGGLSESNDVWIETSGSPNPKNFGAGHPSGFTNFPQVTMTPGNWFRLRLDLTKTGVATYVGTARLYDLGSTGSNTPALLASNNFNFSSSDLGNAARLFPGFFLLSATPGADNFNSTAACCAPPPNDMVSWWRAEGNAVDTLGNHNGTIVGPVTFGAGEVGQSFAFNSQLGYIDTGAIVLPETFTIDAWINPANVNSVQFIMAGNQSYQFALNNDALSLSVENAENSFTSYITPNGVIGANTWQHVAATYDGNAAAGQRIKLYVNGQLISSPSIIQDDGGGLTTPATTYIGIYPDGQHFNFSGSIDEVEVFNRALTANEIAELYNAGGTGKCVPATTPSPTPTPTPTPTPSPTPTPTPTATPTVTTTAGGDVSIGSGAKLTDSAVLSGGDNPTGTITFKLWDPSNNVVYTNVVTVDGNGTYTTASGNNPGGYLPTVTGAFWWRAKYSGDANNAQAIDNGQNETQHVLRANPGISTVAGSTVTLGSGQKMNDSATLTGGYNPTGLITFRLRNSSDIVLYTNSVVVNGAGPYDTTAGDNPGGYLPNAAGTYKWSAHYSGDTNNEEIDDNGDNETQLVVPASPTPTPTPTLNNPNFEIGPFFQDGTVTGWQVQGRVAANTQGATTVTHSAALSSGGNSQNDMLSQSFETISGQMYAVDFDAGIFGKRTGAPLQVRVEISGNGTLVNQLITPPDANTYNAAAVIFQHYRFTFTANSASTTLKFTSVGLGNANADQEIDTVIVSLVTQSPTPTPTPTPTPSPAAALANPNFEIGPFNQDGTVTGWRVTGKVADNPQQGATSGSRCAALSSGGNSQGDTLYQEFSTVPDQIYAIDFDAGIFGKRTGAPLQLRVEILGSGGALVDQIITPPDASTYNVASVKFGHYRFIFTANSPATALRFTSVGLGNAAADQVVDTVVLSNVVGGNPALTNPNFEEGPFSTDGTITGWDVTGKVAANQQGATTFSHSAALSSGGNSQGDTLSQKFFTVPGQMYAVDFDAGIFGRRTSTPLQLRTEVIGSGTLVNQLLTPPDANTWDPALVQFQHYRITFLANSSMTTLRFTSIGLGNAAADQVVDTVSVSVAP